MGHPLDLALLRDFAIALLIGALAGIDREKKKTQEGGVGIGGIRTFLLLALLGATSGHLAKTLDSSWVFAAALLAVSASVVAGYWLHSRTKPEAIGLTTEFAALAVFLLGGLSTAGQPELAVPLGIVVSAALAYKEPLHTLVKRIDSDDFYAALKLLIASFIVLPVLPNRTIDPWGAVNPYKLWLLVILISGLSLVGYVATRWLGTGRGLAITGLSGGLVSSTAVTLSFAKRSREEGFAPENRGAILTGVLLAWTVMIVRVVVIVGVANTALVKPLLGPFAAMGLATVAAALVLYLRSGRTAGTPEEGGRGVPLKNPFSLTAAGKFALLFLVVLLLVKMAGQYASGRGFYLVAFLAGLTDMDAIALSMSDYAQQGGAATTAVRAVTLAALSNTLFKSGLIFTLGSPALRTPTLLATATIIAAGALALLFF